MSSNRVAKGKGNSAAAQSANREKSVERVMIDTGENGYQFGESESKNFGRSRLQVIERHQKKRWIENEEGKKTEVS